MNDNIYRRHLDCKCKWISYYFCWPERTIYWLWSIVTEWNISALYWCWIFETTQEICKFQYIINNELICLSFSVGNYLFFSIYQLIVVPFVFHILIDRTGIKCFCSLSFIVIPVLPQLYNNYCFSFTYQLIIWLEIVWKQLFFISWLLLKDMFHYAFD